MDVRQGNGILQSILQKRVERARKEGVLASIQRKRLGVQISLRKSILIY
jgi:hypothetical protein